jgi:hypothetical protein
VKQDGGGILQIHTRSPDGTDYRATSSGSNATIRALGTDGTVVYGVGGSVYAIRAPYTGAPVRVSSDWFHGRFRFSNGELQLFLGRSVFRVAY